MANYKPYPKYKDSGIPWLGEIPEHWEETKPKFIGYLFSGLSGKSGNDFSKDFVNGYKAYIPFTNIANNRNISLKNLHYVRINDNEKQNRVQKGDLFFLMSSENFEDIGKTALLKNEVEDVYLNSFCKGFRIINKNFDSNFLNYLFSADVNRKQLIIQARGFTRINLKIGKVNDLQLFVPANIEEQTAIARFLDYKLAKINRFIQKKKQLIKLLNEQKAAIINQAVTKGIKSTDAMHRVSTKMKDSGIEWLGEIPEHWEVRKLKYVANCFPSNVDKHSNENEKQVRLCNYTDVYKNDYITDSMDLMLATATDEQIKKFTLLQGDVIITKDSETANDIAVPAYVKEPLTNVVCGYHLSVLRPYETLYGEFLFRVLQCKEINIQFEVRSNGVTRVGLGVYDLKNAKIPVPPINEQTEIVKYIFKETSTIYTTISTIEKEIALVEEYKTALIAEAVTGKIDVRGYEIPEITEEETYEEIEDPDSYRDSMAAEDGEEYENESDL